MSVPVTADGIANLSRGARTRRRWLALAHASWLVCAALALLIFLAAIPLGYIPRFSGDFGVPIDAPAWYVAVVSLAHGIVSILTTLVCLALAALLFWKRRDEPMTLFVSFFLLAYGITLAGPLQALNGFRPVSPGSATQGEMVISVNVILEIQSALFALMPLLFYLFPNGRFVPGWTRYAGLLALLMVPGFIRVFSAEWPSAMTPFAWLVFSVSVILLGVGIYAQIYRYRRVASPLERQQSKWVVFGLVLTFAIMMVLQIPYAIVLSMPKGIAHPWWQPLTGLGWWLSLTILPLSLAIAVMRYRLWDIDIIINRTLVYGALSAFVVGVYVLSVGAFGALFQTSGNLLISLLATAAIAVLFQPLRERLQRGVNRLMYGERDDPYRVLTGLGIQLESSMDPSSALARTVETVAAALKLPYVAIALEQEGRMQTVAAHGTAPNAVSRFPLIHAGEPIGELVAAARTQNESLTSADERLLRDLARQIGFAARTVALTSDLEQARLRIVTERGEARRQLGSDLHDGVGHQLVALTRKIESVMPKPPDSSATISNQLLDDVKQQLVAMTTQVRNLAHQLYPPELEVLGLSGALRERVHAYPTLKILVNAPETLPPLPAEIETAAYYIALEALTNVDKHAQAKVCTIHLKLSSADSTSQQHLLELDIVDDGRGIATSVTHGLGLLTMRARAAEVGGTCQILSNPGGGTAVRVQIPYILKVE